MEGSGETAWLVHEAIANSGERYEVGEGGFVVPLDTPNCCAETMKASVQFSDCGRVSFSVRDELGIQNSLMQPLLESARRRVDSLLPEGVSISLFRAPDEAANFEHTERHFHAELSG